MEVPIVLGNLVVYIIVHMLYYHSESKCFLRTHTQQCNFKQDVATKLSTLISKTSCLLLTTCSFDNISIIHPFNLNNTFRLHILRLFLGIPGSPAPSDHRRPAHPDSKVSPQASCHSSREHLEPRPPRKPRSVRQRWMGSCYF